MLLETMKQSLVTAIKEKDETSRDILRLVIGDVEGLVGRSVKMSDELVYSVIRTHIKNNNEAMTFYEDKECAECLKLKSQTALLENMLPKTLTVREIRDQIREIEHNIAHCSNDGKAIGFAMGFFKRRGDNVLGADVKAVVEFIRS